jgi:multidrug resistance efflux pump
MNRNTWIIVLAGSLLLMGCGAASSHAASPTAIPTVAADLSTIAEGRLEPVRYVDIALDSSGLVSEVPGAEGQAVQAGQVIARLENSQVQNLDTARAAAAKNLAAAYKKVYDTQNALDNFDVPSDFAGLTPAQAADKTLQDLGAARADFEPYRYISEKWLRPTHQEEMTQVYKDAGKYYKRQLDDAWAYYQLAVKWLQLQSDVDNAAAQLAQAQRNSAALQDPASNENTAGLRAALANAEVRAPFSGTITSQNLKVGEFASSGQAAVTLADFSTWVVKTTNLTEVDVVNIRLGQPVTLTLDAMPGLTLHGQVTQISQSYTEKQGDIDYVVTVQLTDHDARMRWGMTAQVKFAQ